MSDDEALARALQMSLQSAPNANRQAALARQQANERNRSNNNSSDRRNPDKCSMC